MTKHFWKCVGVAIILMISADIIGHIYPAINNITWFFAGIGYCDYALGDNQ